MSLEQIRSIKKNETYAVKAFKELKRLIMLDKLKVGTVLSERLLAEQLDISRTPISIALQMLEVKGWIAKSGNKKIVLPISLEDLIQKGQIRLALEILAVDLAKDKLNDARLEHMKKLIEDLDKYHKDIADNVTFLEIDKEFHMYMSKVSGNENLHEILDNLMEQLLRGNLITLKQGFVTREYLNLQHNRMYDCLEKRDFDTLKLLLKEHMVEWSKRLKENWG